jgi:hypothetical protein
MAHFIKTKNWTKAVGKRRFRSTLTLVYFFYDELASGLREHRDAENKADSDVRVRPIRCTIHEPSAK